MEKHANTVAGTTWCECFRRPLTQREVLGQPIFSAEAYEPAFKSEAGDPLIKASADDCGRLRCPCQRLRTLAVTPADAKE